MRPGPKLLLTLPELAPEQAWRLVGSLFAQRQCLALSGLALSGVEAVCLACTAWRGFAALLALSVVCLALRLWLAGFYLRRAASPAGDPRAWARRYTLGAVATACVWCATDLCVLLKFDDPPLQLLVLMVQAVWLGGVVPHNGAAPLAVAVQTALVLLPSLAAMLLAGERFLLVAAPFILLQFVATRSAGRRLDQQIDSALTLERRLAAANAQLLLVSATDGLTGIGNRRAFDAALQTEWARASREASDLAVVMADVDFFKPYNDHYGHLAGDDCLRAVARLAQQALRRPPDLAARFGGEEFAALLPATGEAGARDVAERLRLAVESAALPHAASPFGTLTVSLGVASLAPQPGQEPTALIGLADRALYDAKQAGRNCVRGATDMLKLGPWEKLVPSRVTPPIPHGIEVLVLEDDGMVAAMLADMLTDLGCIVRGPCLNVETALALIETEAPRIALLDLYLGRGMNSYAVADALAASGVPFAFVTADGGADLRPDLTSRPLLQKPFRLPMLTRLIGDLARDAAPAN